MQVQRNLAFSGLYIVDKDYKRKGYRMKTFTAGLAIVIDFRSLGPRVVLPFIRGQIFVLIIAVIT